MENLFVPYYLALRLKALGFNEPCFALYSAAPEEYNKFLWATTSIDHIKEFSKKGHKFFNEIESTRIQHFIKNDFGAKTVTAPLYQQVVDWFKAVHNCHIDSKSEIVNEFGKVMTTWEVLIVSDFKNKIGYSMRRGTASTLEKAVETALNYSK